ncbi:hypothetical protein [Brachyspira pilosicoli]|uniref:hypothetical protein n=1 Tax=Brachyspira pilosicoli TaxID=52584 RepID=UPI001CA4CF0D|nr:hypothetical protein [Brachyspira pilosicoli]
MKFILIIQMMNIMFLYILEKRKCYKNYSNNYDELNLVFENKDALINKNIEMKCQE